MCFGFVTPLSVCGPGGHTIIWQSSGGVGKCNISSYHHFAQPNRRTRVLASATSSSSSSPAGKSVIKEGQVVAVQRGKSESAKKRRPELAVVTGAASSGETVDVKPLKAFVKELYVTASDETTFEKAGDIRVVPSEYVESQDGWIVLDQDVDAAANYFKSRSVSSNDATESVVVESERVSLSEEAKQRQVFRPSKQQAFVAAALSLPLAAGLYAAFASAREMYESSPVGTEFVNGSFFRALVLFATAGGSVASLVVGSALFLYASSKKDDS